MTSQPEKQTVAINTLPNISRSNGNQRMKRGQLTEQNMRNIFLEKSNEKCGREIVPRPFFKKTKLSVSLDQQFKVLYTLFLLYEKFRAIEVHRNLDRDHLLQIF